MPIRALRFSRLLLACFVLLLSARMPAGAQTKAEERTPSKLAPDYSGMYSFLSDGEFVQLTVENQGHVIGFISRYADSVPDAGFVEQFFESGQLDGNQLAFTTKAVHGVSFQFRGTIERGEGKNRADEAYYLLKGTLVEKTTDEAKKTSSYSHEVAWRSFPQDLAPPHTQNKTQDK
jgi:hypothetical protein